MVLHLELQQCSAGPNLLSRPFVVNGDGLIQVELVRAPEGSVVGERVRVEGSEGEPLTPAQVLQAENPREMFGGTSAPCAM